MSVTLASITNTKSSCKAKFTGIYNYLRVSINTNGESVNKTVVVN